MENNKFNFDKLTRIVTEKYGNNFDLDNMEDIDTNLQQMSKDLEDMLKSEMGGGMVELGFINTSDNQDPTYVYDGDSGFDLRANLPEPITLGPLERFLVPTGLSFQIPVGYEIQVRPRSGLAAKQGLSVLNTPGTVDQGYTGEVKVILVNLSNEKQTINHGDRIAQAVLCPVLTKRTTTLVPVNKLTKTDRGDGGFGSTGKQ
jgi:dUTP pyrophosphatase